MTFNELKITDPILKAIGEKGYLAPTPIQQKGIPVALDGRDMLGIAQTGTGKTAAFAIPILQHLSSGMQAEPTDVPRRNRRGRNHGREYGVRPIRALILTPTRELAVQIGDSFSDYGKYVGLKHLTIFGGVKQGPQVEALRGGVDILIATPGRLHDLIGQGFVELDAITHFVLDEADRMLDMGFYEDIMQIAKYLPKERQTIMFSATMPAKIQQLANTILNDPSEIKLAVSKPAEKIIQAAYVCYENQKLGIIRSLFMDEVPERVIVFASSKIKVKEVAKALKSMKLNVGEMHSDLEQAQRETVMHEFKAGRINILVATDIVARGIDIDDIRLVINFDVPHDSEDYVHRIGRTARANNDGVALTFINEKEQSNFKSIENFLEKEIYKIPIPEGLGEAPEYKPRSFNKNRNGNFSKRKDFRGKRNNGGKKSNYPAPRQK